MMSSFSFTGPTVSTQTAQPFDIKAVATSPAIQIKIAAMLFLVVLTMATAGFATFQPSNASQAEGLTNLATQGLAATKTDRVAQAPAPSNCSSQAWGAWSEDCAAALTGASKVRNVSYVTVAENKPTANETILSRYPTQ